MRKGKVHIAYAHFLGYRKGADGRPEIVEEEAEIIRKIYNLYLSGWTIRHIAKQLTEEEIPTPCGKSKWHTSTIESILSNEKYKGDALLQKTYTEDYLTKKFERIMEKSNSIWLSTLMLLQYKLESAEKAHISCVK